jgi:hypothetical protein
VSDIPVDIEVDRGFRQLFDNLFKPVRVSPSSSPRTLSRLADAAAKFLGGFTRVRAAAGALSLLALLLQKYKY